MPGGGKTAAAVLLAALVLGVLVAKRHEIASPARTAARDPVGAAESAGRTVSSWLTVRQLRIPGADGSTALSIGESREGSPVLWMTNTKSTAVLELGAHGNGFPYVLVSDGTIRTFGLGRVDGAQASPILVFRREDVVRMVFGLDMVDKHRSPFLVQYTADGAKHDVIGHYCDRPDRVCVR